MNIFEQMDSFLIVADSESAMERIESLSMDGTLFSGLFEQRLLDRRFGLHV